MVALTFPDGARRDYPNGITGLDVAKGISPSLAKRTVAMALDGAVSDLSDPIERDAKIEFLTREDPRALELIRHDAAHVLASVRIVAANPSVESRVGGAALSGIALSGACLISIASLAAASSKKGSRPEACGRAARRGTRAGAARRRGRSYPRRRSTRCNRGRTRWRRLWRR